MDICSRKEFFCDGSIYIKINSIDFIDVMEDDG